MHIDYDKLVEKSNNPDKMKKIVDRLKTTDFNPNTFVGKELKELPKVIDDGETIIYAATGSVEDHTALVIVTNKRLVIINKNMLVGSSNYEIPINKINEVSYKNSIMFGKVSFTNGATTNTIGVVEKTVTPKLTDAIRNASREASENNNNSEQSTSNNNGAITADKLKEMKGLVDDGIISQDEFEAAKKKYLGL